METVLLEETRVPVKEDYDVIVIGGGTAGVLAGISSARKGLKTIIIEQFGSLGGSATLGLVTPLMTARLPENGGHCALSMEIYRRLKELGGTDDNPHHFDSMILKCVLEDMVTESNCNLLYYSTPVQIGKCVDEGNSCLDYIIINNKDGLSAYRAKYFIDATGDADIAVKAGVPYEVGDQQGINQPVSLRFEADGIDFDKFHSFLRELGVQSDKYFAMNTPGMKDIMLKAVKDGILTDQDALYFQAFGIPGRSNAMAFNCPELSTKENVVDAEFLTKKQLDGKKAILRIRRFLRERIPGFKNVYITAIAEVVGIRESRRIHAEYVMTMNDLLNYRKFNDAVARSAYPIDVHTAIQYDDETFDSTLGIVYNEHVPKEEKYWEVPYRCMVAKGVSNLLVVGRCAGFDFIVQSAARVQLVCRSMGEAAGIACALAREKNSFLKDVDGSLIRKQMVNKYW